MKGQSPGRATLDSEALGAALADAVARAAEAESKASEAETRAAEAEAWAAAAEARASDAEARIAALTLLIEKLRRELYGRRSERKARLLNQLELELDELTASAAEDELAAARAVAGSTKIEPPIRRRPARKPFPADLPRERVVVPAPEACASCGSDRLSKVGEDVTETLEVVPRRWKVIQTVREKFTCRDCERISRAPGQLVPVQPVKVRQEGEGKGKKRLRSMIRCATSYRLC